MNNDWLANKLLMLAEEVERRKDDEFMLLELEDKQIKEKDVVMFTQNKWSESRVDILNYRFNYRIIMKDIKHNEKVSSDELANEFLNRVSEETKLKICEQIEIKGKGHN